MYIKINKELAKKIGLKKALVLSYIDDAIQSKSKRPDIHLSSFKDGSWWVKKTYSSWSAELPYVGTERTFLRMFIELEKMGLIIADTFNECTFDKTRWYTLDYEKIKGLV